MYAHERSLVTKYKNKPFALIGINSDTTSEVAREAVKKNNLNWRSFFAGTRGGKIAPAWKISGWPTMFVIDQKGIIREKIVGANAKKLDAAIEAALKNASEGNVLAN